MIKGRTDVERTAHSRLKRHPKVFRQAGFEAKSNEPGVRKRDQRELFQSNFETQVFRKLFVLAPLCSMELVKGTSLVILTVAMLCACPENAASRSLESDVDRSRAARRAPSPHRVCIDVVDFYHDLNDLHVYCHEGSHQSHCRSQLNKLVNQAELGESSKIGSGKDTTRRLTAHLAEHTRGLTPGEIPAAPRLDTKQQLRNVTFHLAVFCAAHPHFCKLQLTPLAEYVRSPRRNRREDSSERTKVV